MVKVKPKDKEKPVLFVGRPTIYDEKTIKKTKKYIEGCIDDLKAGKVNLPKVEGLALYLKVHRDTLYEWAKKHDEFSDILESLKQEQANRLLDCGLAGKYNPTIVKLLLVKHGYRDEAVTEHKGKVVILD